MSGPMLNSTIPTEQVPMMCVDCPLLITKSKMDTDGNVTQTACCVSSDEWVCNEWNGLPKTASSAYALVHNLACKWHFASMDKLEAEKELADIRAKADKSASK